MWKRIPSQKTSERAKIVSVCRLFFLVHASAGVPERRPCRHRKSAYFCCGTVQPFLLTRAMTEKEIIQIENEVFTRLVIDLLKQQRAQGITDFCLDKYEVDKETKERVRKIISEGRK